MFLEETSASMPVFCLKRVQARVVTRAEMLWAASFGKRKGSRCPNISEETNSSTLLSSTQRPVEPLGLVDEENPNAESTLQKEMKEKIDDPAEPSQEPSREQQSIHEDTNSSTSPTSQGETTEEEQAPLSEDQDSQEQLKGTSEESTKWRLKTRRSTSRYYRNHIWVRLVSPPTG